MIGDIIQNSRKMITFNKMLNLKPLGEADFYKFEYVINVERNLVIVHAYSQLHLVNTRKVKVIRSMNVKSIGDTYNNIIACPNYKKIVFIKDQDFAILNYMNFQLSIKRSPTYMSAGCRFQSLQNLILGGGNSSNVLVILNLENNEILQRRLPSHLSQIKDI